MARAPLPVGAMRLYRNKDNIYFAHCCDEQLTIRKLITHIHLEDKNVRLWYPTDDDIPHLENFLLYKNLKISDEVPPKFKAETRLCMDILFDRHNSYGYGRIPE